MGYLQKTKEFKETGESDYIYRNELDKTCFKHDIVYGDFKDLPRRTVSDKVLLGKAFASASNPPYDGYQHILASVVYRFFDKKAGDISTHTGAGIGISENQQSVSYTSLLL